MSTYEHLTSHARHPLHSTIQEEQSKKKHHSKKTVQNLIAAGILEPGSSRGSNSKKRGNAGTSLRAIRISWKQHSSRHSNAVKVLPSSQLNLDQLSSHENGTASGSSPVDAGGPPLAEAECKQSLSANSLTTVVKVDMFSTEGSNRRERTFVGCSCAACEEPLEHILHGERILQLSCGHVAHEACFHEYIKQFQAQNCPTCGQPLGIDTSRGGNIDFDQLNKLVRSTQILEARDQSHRTASTPVSWDADNGRRSMQSEIPIAPPPLQRAYSMPARDEQRTPRYERYTISNESHGSQQKRQSTSTGAYSNDYSESQQERRHDYDLHCMEASVASLRSLARGPIPTPLVTVRSEFPTLTRSRNQQSLTCLVTVEVVDSKWQSQSRDLRSPAMHTLPVAEEPIELASQPPARLRPVSQQPKPVDSVHEDTALQQAKEELFRRVKSWHGLDTEKFGRLVLHDTLRVGKDRRTWQQLECFLFTEMLICVKERKVPAKSSESYEAADYLKPRGNCTLKGSILVKKHLQTVETSPEQDVLTMTLSVAELPAFHIQFREKHQLDIWRKALSNIVQPDPPSPACAQPDYDHDTSEDEYISKRNTRVSSAPSSWCNRSQVTAPTDYSAPGSGAHDLRLGTTSLHVPLDIVVVVPVTSSMQGLKINLLRGSLRFLVSGLGERDRMGLVTFGSGSGAAPLVGMTTKSWAGWTRAIDSIRTIGLKSMRADVVDGANVAVDLLMQRKSWNPLSHILLISDSSTSDSDSVDFVVSRAEAAKISIHSFGLGLTHKPDTMVALSTKTKASYTYVKDWMMLRECVAGCLGGLQSISHQNVKVKLRLPEGSPAKFMKISGAINITKRATGRDAEASLGDLRFGDKRDILVQLAIQPDSSTPDSVPSDPWENLISGLEALGPMEHEEVQMASIEELPLLQADLQWGDILREGHQTQLPRPSLLAITMLPSPKNAPHGRPLTPPIPPHPAVVQRRMELLTSDMLSRALGLVSRGQNDRAQHLLAETRSILKGLGKGGLPPLPTPPPTGALPLSPRLAPGSATESPYDATFPVPPSGVRTSSPSPQEMQGPLTPGAGIDRATMAALDSELVSSLEWIGHPTVFGRDTRKAVLQAIGVISSQRGNSFRTASESLWAQRVLGIRRLTDRSLEWREGSDAALVEVSEPATSTTSSQTYR